MQAGFKDGIPCHTVTMACISSNAAVSTGKPPSNAHREGGVKVEVNTGNTLCALFANHIMLLWVNLMASCGVSCRIWKGEKDKHRGNFCMTTPTSMLL